MSSCFPVTSQQKAKTALYGLPPFVELTKSLLFSVLAYSEPAKFSQDFSVQCPAVFFERFSEAMDIEHMEFIDSSKQANMEDAQLYVWMKNRVVTVAFRGSSSVKDVVTDLDTLTYSFEKPGVRVHEGFYKQFKAIEPQLSQFLAQRNGQFDRILFTGHSLGGALASIAAAHYTHQLPTTKVAVHTFGCPRVGNKAFCRFYSELVSEHWRVINKDDPAALYPMGWHYYHIQGSTVCLMGNSQYQLYNNDVQWWSRCGASLNNIDWGAFSKPHKTDLYMQNLLQLANEKGDNNSVVLPDSA
jgi:hypothetical protein